MHRDILTYFSLFLTLITIHVRVSAHFAMDQQCSVSMETVHFTYIQVTCFIYPGIKQVMVLQVSF